MVAAAPWPRSAARAPAGLARRPEERSRSRVPKLQKQLSEARARGAGVGRVTERAAAIPGPLQLKDPLPLLAARRPDSPATTRALHGRGESGEREGASPGQLPQLAAAQPPRKGAGSENSSARFLPTAAEGRTSKGVRWQRSPNVPRKTQNAHVFVKKTKNKKKEILVGLFCEIGNPSV